VEVSRKRKYEEEASSTFKLNEDRRLIIMNARDSCGPSDIIISIDVTKLSRVGRNEVRDLNGNIPVNDLPVNHASSNIQENDISDINDITFSKPWPLADLILAFLLSFLSETANSDISVIRISVQELMDFIILDYSSNTDYLLLLFHSLDNYEIPDILFERARSPQHR
jgi:hypothetical protein